MSSDRTYRASIRRFAMAVPALALAFTLSACGGDAGSGGSRATVDEVSTGFQKIMADAGAGDLFTEDQVSCVAQALIDSDIPSEDLATIAGGEDVGPTSESNDIIRTVIADSRETCLK